MKFTGYHFEKPHKAMAQGLKRHNNNEQKTDFRAAFKASGLRGVSDDDFSILPRVLPASYMPTLRQSAFLVTKFAMRILSLPEQEIRAIVPRGPIRDYLLDELQVVKYRKGRITGSFRFDMAIVGPPDARHPPKLLEINEIGFDGLARSSFFQKTLLELMPDLRGRLRSLDTAAAEVRNMQRLGNKMARIQYDSYNWDEDYLLRTAERMGQDLRLISPTQFGLELDKHSPLLQKKQIRLVDGRVAIGKDWFPNALNMSFAYSLSDYHEGHTMYRNIVRAKTPQYGPFLTGLVATKTILILLADPYLRRKLLGSERHLAGSILPAHLLSQEIAKPEKLKKDWALKYTDGFGGEQVFMNQDLVRKAKRIPPSRRHEWVLQEKTQLNLIDVNGLLSRPKEAIADLGVFIEYDWSHGRFQHFEVGGLMARATNKSLKVNVSSGGCQVAVLLDRKA